MEFPLELTQQFVEAQGSRPRKPAVRLGRVSCVYWYIVDKRHAWPAFDSVPPPPTAETAAAPAAKATAAAAPSKPATTASAKAATTSATAPAKAAATATTKAAAPATSPATKSAATPAAAAPAAGAALSFGFRQEPLQRQQLCWVNKELVPLGV